MIRTVTVLTPDALNPHYEGRWQAAFERYRTLFGARGLQVTSLPWTQMADSRADLTLVELAWGYHRHPQHFTAALDAWPSHRRLVNAAPLLRWNMRKTYLDGLAQAGVMTIPTVFVDDPSTVDMIAAAERFGTEELVVKPQISAGSHLTLRVRPRDEASLPGGPCMIQPFLPEVGGEGELSLFLFGSEFAYGVRKVAADGDFRIQPQYGGRLSLFTPDAEARSLATAAVAACPVPPAYARCDMVRGLDGRLQLMELECIEPDLYLDLAPDGGAAFVDAVLGA